MYLSQTLGFNSKMDFEELGFKKISKNNTSRFGLSAADRDNLLLLLIIPARVYLHELGHLIANTMLYTNSSSTISLKGLGLNGGLCQTTFRGLPIFSSLGKSLESFSTGATSSVISAAGPLVDIVCLLALSIFSKKSKVISRSQMMASYFLVAYGASALITDKNNCNGHDFCNIWAKSGIWAYGAMMAACIGAYKVIEWQEAGQETECKRVGGLPQSRRVRRGSAEKVF